MSKARRFSTPSKVALRITRVQTRTIATIPHRTNSNNEPVGNAAILAPVKPRRALPLTKTKYTIHTGDGDKPDFFRATYAGRPQTRLSQSTGRVLRSGLVNEPVQHIRASQMSK